MVQRTTGSLRISDHGLNTNVFPTPSLCSLCSTWVLLSPSLTFIKDLIMLLDFDHSFIKCLTICLLKDGFSVMRCIQKENSRSSMSVIWKSLTWAISSLPLWITALVFQAPGLLDCACQGQLRCPKLILKTYDGLEFTELSAHNIKKNDSFDFPSNYKPKYKLPRNG